MTQKLNDKCILKCTKDVIDKDNKVIKEGTLLIPCFTEDVSTLLQTTFLVDVDDNEYCLKFTQVVDHFKPYDRGYQKTIGLGDYVYYLKDARKHYGTIIKVNKKTVKIKTNGSNWFKYPEEMNIDIERVAHQDDVCTIVCDYIKDPNGKSVRFEHGDDYCETHKPLSEWGSQPSQFVDII